MDTVEDEVEETRLRLDLMEVLTVAVETIGMRLQLDHMVALSAGVVTQTLMDRIPLIPTVSKAVRVGATTIIRLVLVELNESPFLEIIIFP